MERRLHLQPGAYVSIEEQRFRITQVMDLETVLIEDVETGQARPVKIRELQNEGLNLRRPVKAQSVELVVGFKPELGYFSLNELKTAKEGMRGLRALPIERDVWFEPKRLSEIRREHDDL